MDALKVLLVDDDKNIRKTLQASLKALGCEVQAAESAEEALRALGGGEFDLLLTDVRLGGRTGVELTREARALPRAPSVVVMTAYASFENAVAAIQAGAFDYLPKPFTSDQLAHLLSKIRELAQLKRENERLKAAGKPELFEGMVSPAMRRLEEFVARVAPTDATVLLTGETGTGKTELARLIHRRSSRASGPFVVVDCGSLTDSILESELFGHVKGAFTGAVQDQVGKLEQARGGTVLIDEVGELSAAAQTRLLRFLQEKVIERVGGGGPVAVDARVIAATNRNLEESVRDGAFREDLYFRLNVFECAVVPLRFRREDLPVLIGQLLAERSFAGPLPEPVTQRLLAYDWPGNVRELRNVIERLVILSSGRTPEVSDLPEALRLGGAPRAKGGAHAPEKLPSIDELVRAHIERVLKLEPNQERAAAILGITTVTLWRKRKEYGLP